MTTPQLRADLRPLCPRHNTGMKKKGFASHEYVCSADGCRFHWRVQDGYFQMQDGALHFPPEAQQYLKPALVSEHGYLYIASVDGSPRLRTWRCAVKDCPNTIVEDA